MKFSETEEGKKITLEALEDWHKAKVAYRTDVDDAIDKAFEAGRQSMRDSWEHECGKYDEGFANGQAAKEVKQG